MREYLLLLFLLAGHTSLSQTFLDDFKAFKLQQLKSDKTLDSLRRSKENKTLNLTKKNIREGKKQWSNQIEKQIIQFDTIFRSYKKQKGFDYNLADSLLIVYQTDIQSNLNRFIIISSRDTISYRERWKMRGLHIYERQIFCEPFLDTTQSNGFVIFDDRDSLLTLASKRDFNAAKKLAKENPCSDGSTSTIIFAKRTKGHYHFEYCFLQPFMIKPIWGKE